ncbi:hypothetical protein LCGC14_2470140, partial [marine sediment metagenome]
RLGVGLVGPAGWFTEITLSYKGGIENG